MEEVHVMEQLQGHARRGGPIPTPQKVYLMNTQILDAIFSTPRLEPKVGHLGWDCGSLDVGAEIDVPLAPCIIAYWATWCAAHHNSLNIIVSIRRADAKNLNTNFNSLNVLFV